MDPTPHIAQDDVGVPNLKRKREPLDFVKCDYCRTDKQKCVPLDRDWPDQKCDRCIKKGFPCSEGTRKQRRTKHMISKEPSSSGAGGELELTFNTEDWVFLLSFHKIMIKALRRLRELRSESRKIIAPDMDAETFFLRYPSPEQEDFEYFVEKLNATIISLTTERLVSKHHQPARVVCAAITGHFLSEDLLVDPAASIYSNDASILEEQIILNELKENEDVSGEFLARVCRLGRNPNFRMDNTKPHDHEWAQLDALISKLRHKCYEVLTRHGLYDYVPSISRTSPFILPEVSTFLPVLKSLDSSWDSQDESARGRLDCLGRTWLHIKFDALPDSSTRTNSEEDIINPDDTLFLKDIQGRTPLHIACQKGLIDYLDPLMDSNLDAKTVYGLQPLHYAAARGSFVICHRLLASGRAYINAVDVTGSTPLYYAVMGGHFVLVNLFLAESSIDPDRSNSDRRPLAVAVRQRDLPMVSMLLESGANPNLHVNGAPYLVYSAEVMDLGLMEMLGERQNINFNVRDSDGWTPIATAAELAFIDGVKYLMGRKEVNLNAANDHGRTPLMLAARAGRKAVVDLLLTNPLVDVFKKDEDGRDALDHSERHPEVRQLLEFEIARRNSDAWVMTVPTDLMPALDYASQT